MKHLLPAFACLLAMSLSAQTDYPFPWNPDADLDGWVSTEDLLQLLTVFNTQFEPDSWASDTLSAAVVLDESYDYVKCQNICSQIEGNWRMADLDHFGQYFDLAEDNPGEYWINTNEGLENRSTDYPLLTATSGGDLGAWGFGQYNGVLQRCMCYIQSSPFVPSQYSEDSNLTLLEMISSLQDQVDSIQTELETSNGEPNESAISMPTGTILAFASDSIPEGWMYCDGAEIAINNYTELYDLIGNTYGSGDSAYWAQVGFPGTTFNLPDLRGRTLVAPDNMGGQAADLLINSPHVIGDIGGSESHALQPSELPIMELDLDGVTLNTEGGCSGGCSPPYLVQGGSGSWYLTEGGSTVSNGGGGQSHGIMQPYAIVNFIVKVD